MSVRTERVSEGGDGLPVEFGPGGVVGEHHGEVGAPVSPTLLRHTLQTPRHSEACERSVTYGLHVGTFQMMFGVTQG